MRWTPGKQSDNIEDRRGTRMRAGAGIGIGGLLILGLLTLVTGRNFLSLAPLLQNNGTSMQEEESGPIQSSPEEQRRVQFVSFVLDDVQDTWRKKLGDRYQDTKLVLFRDAVQTGCGYGQAATGPFYCPLDQKVYLDTSFFRDLERRFRACDAGSKACQFSQAYVITHEVGHHVQNLLGILPRVQQMQQRMDTQTDANALQVRVELQADCLAGVWANHAEKEWQFMDEGDVEAAMQTASAIGDDRLQKQTQGYVVPDAFTHGSAQQRTRWLMTGLKSGNPDSCNTYESERI